MDKKEIPLGEMKLSDISTKKVELSANQIIWWMEVLEMSQNCILNEQEFTAEEMLKDLRAEMGEALFGKLEDQFRLEEGYTEAMHPPISSYPASQGL